MGDTGGRATLNGRRPSGQTLTLVPATAAGVPHDDVLEAMAAVLAAENPPSAAEALRILRRAFPRYPLALRLTALAAAMKRPGRCEDEALGGLFSTTS